MIVDLAGVGVDLDLAGGAAVGKHRIVHLVVGDDGQPVGEIAGQAHVRGLAGEFEHVETAVGLARDEAPVLEGDMVERHLQHRGGDAPSLADQVGGGLGEHRRGVPHRAAGMGPAADPHHVGVAEDDVDLLDRHGEQIGYHLGEARLMALPGRLGADHHIDAALAAAP